MNKFRRIVFACVVLLAGAPALAALPVAKPASQAKQAPQVNFGKTENVLELKSALSPYKVCGG